MKKLIAALALAGVGYVAGSYGLGMMAQHSYDDYTKKVATATGFSIITRSYTRGVFSSEAMTSVDLGAHPMMQAMKQVPGIIEIKHHITHGPLAMGTGSHGLAVAVIHSEVVFPEQTRAPLQQLFGNVPPMELATAIGFGGDTTGVFSIAPAKMTDGSGDLEWQGMSAHFAISKNYDHIEMQGEAPLLSAGRRAGVHVSMRDLRFEFRGDKDASGLWFGPQRAGIGHLEIGFGDANEARVIKFADAVFTGESKRQDDNAVISYGIQVPSIVVDDVTVGPFVFDMAVRNIDINAFAQLEKAMSWSNPDAASQMAAAATSGFKEMIPALLAKSPEMEISRLSLDTPHGNASSKLLVAFKGQPPVDLAAFDTPILLQRLRVNLDVAVSSKLAKQLLSWGVEKQLAQQMSAADAAQAAHEQAEQMLSVYVAQKFIKREGENYTAQLKMLDGHITINGEPMDQLLGLLNPKGT